MSTKKADYIAKYGEEAWAVESTKRSKYSKQWREEHPDYKKQYYENNKEHIAEQVKQYYQVHIEEKREYHKQYRETNKDKIAAYIKEHAEEIAAKKAEYYAANKEIIAEKKRVYYNTHKEEISAYRAEHKDESDEYRKKWYSNHKDYYPSRRTTPYGRAESLKGGYNKSDKERGFDISQNITAKWIVDNIFNSSCVYCGENDWRKLGCDRIDNTKGHTPDNVVCACGKCNAQRRNVYSVEEFIEMKKGSA